MYLFNLETHTIIHEYSFYKNKYITFLYFSIKLRTFSFEQVFILQKLIAYDYTLFTDDTKNIYLL